ncbi:MAG: HemK2/MTQ2 family protein methyltransferase [Nanoarchaeota archaeon]
MSLVYQPAEDSFLLEKLISKYSKNKKVIDIGTGSGILAIKALKSGASSVTAVDLNKDAVKEIKSNNKSIKTIQSNIFSKVKGKFDLIICNPPYLPHDSREDKESSLATSGGKKGDEFILKFLRQAKSHLKENGIILLLFSSLTPRDRINKLLEKLNSKSKIVASKNLFFEKLEVLELKQTPNSKKR